jgi:hypothetical protein
MFVEFAPSLNKLPYLNSKLENLKGLLDEINIHINGVGSHHIARRFPFSRRQETVIHIIDGLTQSLQAIKWLTLHLPKLTVFISQTSYDYDLKLEIISNSVDDTIDKLEDELRDITSYIIHVWSSVSLPAHPYYLDVLIDKQMGEFWKYPQNQKWHVAAVRLDHIPSEDTAVRYEESAMRLPTYEQFRSKHRKLTYSLHKLLGVFPDSALTTDLINHPIYIEAMRIETELNAMLQRLNDESVFIHLTYSHTSWLVHFSTSASHEMGHDIFRDYKVTIDKLLFTMNKLIQDKPSLIARGQRQQAAVEQFIKFLTVRKSTLLNNSQQTVEYSLDGLFTAYMDQLIGNSYEFCSQLYNVIDRNTQNQLPKERQNPYIVGYIVKQIGELFADAFSVKAFGPMPYVVYYDRIQLQKPVNNEIVDNLLRRWADQGRLYEFEDFESNTQTSAFYYSDYGKCIIGLFNGILSQHTPDILRLWLMAVMHRRESGVIPGYDYGYFTDFLWNSTDDEFFELLKRGVVLVEAAFQRCSSQICNEMCSILFNAALVIQIIVAAVYSIAMELYPDIEISTREVEDCIAAIESGHTATSVLRKVKHPDTTLLISAYSLFTKEALEDWQAYVRKRELILSTVLELQAVPYNW